MISPIIEKLAKEHQGRLKFCKLNADENCQTATKYQVMSMRMLVFFKDGRVIEQSLGAISESVLRSKVKSLLPQQYALEIRNLSF